MNIFRSIKNEKIIPIIFSVMISFIFVFAFITISVNGASTISTNISTGGTLSVTGAIYATSTALIDGSVTINDTLTVSTISATSTTATSTFSGGFAVETNGLLYDFSTNNIGVGTSSPGVKFSVNGAGILGSGSTVFGDLSLGSLSATSTTATSTFAGGLTVDTNDFLVDPDAGRVGIASTTPVQELGIVGDIHVGSAATTTITLSSSNTNTGGCINLEGADGTMYRIYATTTGPLIAESGSCQ